jgi:hypothetical protein
MATYLTRLLKMRADLDSLIAEIQGSAPTTPTRDSIAVSTPDAPKKCGRKPLSDEEKAERKAVKSAAKDAATAIEAATDSSTDASEGTKKKRVLSDEHKAKLAAGREARKARLNAEKAAAELAQNTTAS